MNINHDKPTKSSPLAGKTVKIKSNATDIGGSEYHVEDYWNLIAVKSWMFCDGNPACLDYAMRNIGLPVDNNVLYGKIGGAGKLVHVSEIEPDNEQDGEVNSLKTTPIVHHASDASQRRITEAWST